MRKLDDANCELCERQGAEGRVLSIISCHNKGV